MYSNILGVAYLYYAKQKNEEPYSRAVWTAIIASLLHFYVAISLGIVIWDVNVFMLLPSIYIILPFTLLWIFAGFKYYNRDRVKAIVDKFSKHSRLKKIFWETILVISYIAPMLWFPIVFGK